MSLRNQSADWLWARHQPSGLPNARSLCVRLQSASPSRPAEDSGPYKRLPGIIPFLCGRAHGPCPTGYSIDTRLVGRGSRLPTVVPADWQALSCPPVGALPRNRLALSATGGASAISPPNTRKKAAFRLLFCYSPDENSYQNLLKSLKSFLTGFVWDVTACPCTLCVRVAHGILD